MLRGPATGIIGRLSGNLTVAGRQELAPDRDAVAPTPALGLSRREFEVLALVAAGWTNAQVAAALHLSPWTVKRHVSRMLRKLNYNRRVELAVWFEKHEARHLAPRSWIAPE